VAVAAVVVAAAALLALLRHEKDIDNYKQYYHVSQKFADTPKGVSEVKLTIEMYNLKVSIGKKIQLLSFTFKAFILAAIVLCVGACASPNSQTPINFYSGSNEISKLNEKIIAQAHFETEPGEILIGEGDLLEISVFEAKDLDKTVRVNSRGFISLPLTGEILISGLTPIEAEEKIEEIYKRRFIKDPHVSIFIEEQISQRITLVGQFKNPGTYDYLSNQRLLDVIALGGGLSERAGQTVQVRRTRYVQGEPNTFIVDLDRLIKEGNVELNIRLNGGDVLFVPEAGVFFVDGAVKRPGAYPIKHKTVVQEGLVESGGFESNAKKDRVKLVRITESGERKIIDLDLSKSDSKEMALKDRDILIVDESGLGGLGRGFSITVLGTGFTYWPK
jgi:polysaccharide export outer membrane protein